MDRRFFKKILPFCLVICISLFQVSAAELYMDEYPLRWNIKSGSVYQTKCNDFGVPTNHPCYGTIYSGVTRFNSSSPSMVASLYQSNILTANVHYQVPSTNYWGDIVDAGGVYGMTVPMDMNYKEYKEPKDYAGPARTILIKSANIYYNPNNGAYDGFSYNQYVQLAMHELGHAYGMGHEWYTVMQEGMPTGQYASGLTAKDRQILTNFYG